jgi:hypothetical protein
MALVVVVLHPLVVAEVQAVEDNMEVAQVAQEIPHQFHHPKEIMDKAEQVVLAVVVAEQDKLVEPLELV